MVTTITAPLTLDSSVFVAALRKEERAHDACLRLLEKVKNGNYIAIEPYTVLIEIVAAVKRRTGSSELASKIRTYLESMDNVVFLELVKNRADDCAKICEKLFVRGMDSIVIQTACENNAILVTLDREMEEQAEKMTKTAPPDKL